MNRKLKRYSAGEVNVRAIVWRLFLVLSLVGIAAPARAQKLERAVLAFGSTGPNLTTFWLAREAGLYKQYGLDVDVVFFRGSTIAINALATKDAHFGAFGASSAVLARLGGLDTVLSPPRRRACCFIWYKERDQRRGRSERQTHRRQPAWHGLRFAARVAAQKLGLGEKDVNIIAMGTDSERLAAMSQGVVDATVVTVGGYVAAQKLGFHSILGSLASEYSL